MAVYAGAVDSSQAISWAWSLWLGRLSSLRRRNDLRCWESLVYGYAGRWGVLYTDEDMMGALPSIVVGNLGVSTAMSLVVLWRRGYGKLGWGGIKLDLVECLAPDSAEPRAKAFRAAAPSCGNARQVFWM